MDAELARLLNSSEEDRQKALEIITLYWNNDDDDQDMDMDNDFLEEDELDVPAFSDSDGETPVDSSDSRRETRIQALVEEGCKSIGPMVNRSESIGPM